MKDCISLHCTVLHSTYIGVHTVHTKPRQVYLKCIKSLLVTRFEERFCRPYSITSGCRVEKTMYNLQWEAGLHPCQVKKSLYQKPTQCWVLILVVMRKDLIAKYQIHQLNLFYVSSLARVTSGKSMLPSVSSNKHMPSISIASRDTEQRHISNILKLSAGLLARITCVMSDNS